MNLAIGEIDATAVLVYLLGVLTKWGSQRSALVGLMHGIAILTAVWWWQAAGWPWFSVIGATITFAVGLFVEVLWGSRNWGEPK
ncbi:MAG: hypothetical protein ACODAD_11755 [Planctomycetota bacterium]